MFKVLFLGPYFLYYIYNTFKSDHNKIEDLQHHLFADDTQSFTSLSTSNHSNKINNLQECLISVQDWMLTTKLKLNPHKTEFMLMVNKCHLDKFNSEFPVEMLNNSIPPAAHAKNRGVYIDSDLNFQHYIKNTVEMCNYFIRDIRYVRKHII